MGYPKLMLPFSDNKTFLEEIVDKYLQFGCTQIVVVVNSEGYELLDAGKHKLSSMVEIVLNPNPETGRFSSIQLGLKRITAGNTVFMHNIDNPFVDIDLLKRLADFALPDCWSVPTFQTNRGHPLCMHYNVAKTVLQCEDLCSDIRNIIAGFLFTEVESKTDSILLNINSPEEYLNVFGKEI